MAKFKLGLAISPEVKIILAILTIIAGFTLGIVTWMRLAIDAIGK